MEIFLRDGFVDGYSGDRLIFPGALRLISKKLPKAFPYHSAWKMDECHIAYWDLYPTIDHMIPFAKKGKHEKDNWVLTSQLRNSLKSHWTLEELGWKICPHETLKKWDGMTRWFLDFIDKDKSPLENKSIKDWYKVADQFRSHPLLA
jgi:hypothetical protein